MKRPEKELRLSTDAKVKDYFDAMDEVSFNDSYPEMARWVRRVGKPHRNAGAPSVYLMAPLHLLKGRYSWVTLVVILTLTAGFIPLQEVEVLGHLIYAEIKGDTEHAATHMEQYDFPYPQAVYVRHPGENNTRLVILLPEYTESETEPLVNSLQADEQLEQIQVQRVEEEIERSIYESFFSNLPASMRVFFTRDNVQHMRWGQLYRPYIAEWLDREGVSYGITSSRSNGEIRYNVLAQGITPLPTDREQLFEEYSQIDRAIDLLKSENESVQEARALLEVYKDSLDARISGKRE